MATTGQIAGTLDFREPGWNDQPVSGSDLAKGLMLLRASNMTVIRLQLAMERSDRRTAMEALDGLVALDREIDGFIGEMPPPDPDLSALAQRLDSQKTAIASEKLIFAAGKRGPTIAPGSEYPGREASVEADPTTGETASHTDYSHEEAVPRRIWRTIGFASLFLIALGIAAALYLMATNQLPTTEGLVRILETLR